MIIFAHHLVILNSVSALLRQHGEKHILIGGNTKEKQKLVDDFQFGNEIYFAVLSLTACGVGLNLTAANTVIFTELYWNPGVIV